MTQVIQGGATPQGPTYHSDPSRTLSESYDNGLLLMVTNNSTCVATHNLGEVLKAVHDLVEWKRLGLQLGLLHSTLEKIEKQQLGNIDDCKMKMFSAWLQQQDKVPQKGIPSWSVLQAALKEIGENELADRIVST